MDFGSKYKFKPVAGPSPDKYRLNESQTSPKTKMGIIHHQTSPERRRPDVTPSPGDHDKHLTPMGHNMSQTIPFGDKYKPFKSDTPSCTKYNPDDSMLSTNKRAPSALIREPTMIALDQDLLPS